MNTEFRLAVVSIIIENEASAPQLNDILHEYNEYIIGRMGIPHRTRGVNLISIAMDAPCATVNALTGRIGRIDGVSAKAVFSKDAYRCENE